MPETTSLIAGQFNGTGVSASVVVYGRFNCQIYGGNGVVAIQRALDGTNYNTVSKDADGTPASYDTNVNGFDGVLEEPSRGIKYRLECTSFVAGPINYRISA